MRNTNITIPDNASISAVSEIRHELLAALGTAASGDSILLDASATTSADSSLAQLLLSFKAEAAANGVQVSITGLKESLSLKSLLCCDAMNEPSGKGSL